jgi:hypothetical protein
MMKRIARDLERDLFEADHPGPPISPDQRDKVVSLIQALLLEVPMENTGRESDHE